MLKLYDISFPHLKQVFVPCELSALIPHLVKLRLKRPVLLLSVVELVLNTLDMQFQLLLYLNMVTHFRFILLQLGLKLGR